MKHALVVFLLYSFPSIVFTAETNPINNTHPWELIAEIKQDEAIKSAYFNFQGTSLITSTDHGVTVTDISLQKPLSFFTTKQQIVCLNPSEKFRIINNKCTVEGTSTNDVIYWPYKQRTIDHHAFMSYLPVTPHRCVIQKYGPQRELAGITSEPTPSKNEGYWLRLYDIGLGKITIEYYHPCKIKDFCLHSDKNIVASITYPDPAVRVWNTEKWHRFPIKGYTQELHSIRFDESNGNRLVVTGQDTIDVLDITNPENLTTITSFANTEHSTQACLSGKYLAVASQPIKLFDIETKQEVMSIAGNNNSSPMNCFGSMGNLLVVINDKNALIFKKQENKDTESNAIYKKTIIVTGPRESSDECCQVPCQNQIITIFASIVALLESKFFNC